MDGQGSLFTGQAMPVLRKPKSVSVESDESSNAVKNDTNNESIVSKSTLSADAQEFFPRNYNNYTNSMNTPAPASKSVQSRLQRPSANSLEEQSSSMSVNTIPYSDHYEYNTAELEHLQEVITILTSNPGKFDDTVPALLDSLNMYLNDQPMMEMIVSHIVQQAVSESNFVYSGARMCVIINTYSSELRPSLLKQCENKRFTPNVSVRARNFTLFLAELFLQLDWDKQFGAILSNMIQVLLDFNHPDDIKCICQTLKLAGMPLEISNLDAMEKLISRLNSRLPSLPSSCANLLRCVLDLRAAHWGRSTAVSQQPSSQQTHITHNSLQNDYPPESPFVQRWSDGGPVFYGPDGIELTAEENAFLTDVADDLVHDESDPDALWDPDPEMDEEMISAFKEFVAMTKK